MTRISPGGPAEMAGLMMGDKIMQVCSEIQHWSRDPQDGTVFSSVSYTASGALLTML